MTQNLNAADKAADDVNRRTRILDAALKLFSDRGYDGTSVAMVAKEADVAKPLVSYHFGSKEALWQAAVDLVYGRVHKSLAAAAREREVLDLHGNQWLRHFLRTFMMAVRAEPAYTRLNLQEGGLYGPRLEYLVTHHIKPGAAMLKPLFDVLKDRGFLPPGPDFSHHTILLGLVERPVAFGPAMERTYGEPTTSDAAIEAHLDVVMRVLVGRTGR